MRRTMAIAGGLFALLALGGAASATPAKTVGETRLRSGPGAKFEAVSTIPRGAPVDVNGCRNGWCVVDWEGRQGYLDRQMLSGLVDVGPPLAEPMKAPPPTLLPAPGPAPR